ncbi:hypothetical protein LTS18_014315, partial [Coniosporium uncinatum]
LDEYTRNGDVRSFEKEFADCLHITLKSSSELKKPKKKTKKQNQKQSNGIANDPEPNGISDVTMVNGVEEEHKAPATDDDVVGGAASEPTIPDWELPEQHPRNSLLHRSRIVYALGKIFAWASPYDGAASPARKRSSIIIQFFPPNVFRWLQWLECVTVDLISQSLVQASTIAEAVNTIKPGDLVSALVNFDPTMRLLYTTLHHSHLPILESVHTIKMLVQSLDNSSPPQSRKPKQITQGPEKDGEPLVNGDLEHQVSEETDAALSELDLAFTILQDGVDIRAQSLRQALTKLNAFPASRITQTIRAELTQHETIFLIWILRFELIDGGWVSRYIDRGADAPSSSEAGEPSNRAIAIVANLLSCALDAVGVGGWSMAGIRNPGDGATEMLTSLRAEVSAALEGIHEVNFIGSFVSEFVRLGEKSMKAQKASEFGERPNKGKKVKPVTVIDAR